MSIVILSGEIESATLAFMRGHLGKISPSEPLMVILDRSNGGDVDGALALGDLIRSHCGPTMCRVNGHAHSAAIIVLASCATRRATPSATFKMHPSAAPRSHLVGRRLTVGNLRRAANRLAVVDTRVRGYISRQIGCSVAELDRLERDSAVLDAEGALRIGLLTELCGSSARPPRPTPHAPRSNSEISPALLAKYRRHFGNGDSPIAMSSAFIRRLEAMP